MKLERRNDWQQGMANMTRQGRPIGAAPRRAPLSLCFAAASLLVSFNPASITITFPFGSRLGSDPSMVGQQWDPIRPRPERESSVAGRQDYRRQCDIVATKTNQIVEMKQRTQALILASF